MGRLWDKLVAGTFVLTAEVDPPRGPDITRLAAGVGRFVDLVDAVNVTDCPRANVRMSPVAAAHLLQHTTGIDTVFHITCRDRNLIGLQADLLGASALGLSHLLVLTGDPPGHGNQPDAKGVFDVDAPALVRLISSLNQGRTRSGVELDRPTAFAVAVAANPSAEDQERELNRLAEKVEAGAHFVQTQPVFDADTALAFEERVAAYGLNVPVLYGLMPLKDAAAARRMAAIPGVHVPDHVVRRMEAGGEGEGDRIAAELSLALCGRVRGLHIFPMQRLDAVARIAAAVAEHRSAAAPGDCRCTALGGG